MWECTLSSINKLVTIKLQKKLLYDSVSEFVFVHSLHKSYINTLQDHYYLPETNYIWTQNDQYLFLSNNSPFIKQNEIVMYKKDKLNNHSYYFMPFPNKRLLQMRMLKSEPYLIAFFIHEKRIKIEKFLIRDYEIKIKKPLKILGKMIFLDL